MEDEDINITSTDESQDTTPEPTPAYVFPRRSFFYAGALITATAFVGSPSLQAGEVPPPDLVVPEPDTDQVTPIVDENNSIPTIQELISTYNQYASAYNMQLYPGFTFGSEFTNLSELTEAVNYWGGLCKDIPIPEYIKAGLLCAPISKLYCGSGIPPLPAFTLRLGDISGYEYKTASYGYMAVKVHTENASVASFAESVDSRINNPIDETRYIIAEDDSLASAAGADLAENPKGKRYPSFSEAATANFNENSLNELAREIYPSIRSAYEANLVQIATVDGQFSGIDRVPIYGDHSALFNIDFGGYPFHAVLLHAALHGIFGTNYDSVQMRINDIAQYVEDRDVIAENEGDVKPSVVCLPFNIASPLVRENLTTIFTGKNPDKLKTIVVASTLNADLELQLNWEIPSSVIYCSTVRKDDSGNLYIPINRATITDIGSQDKLFLFPDQTDALGVEFGGEMVGDQLCLFPEFYRVSTSGASLSALVATTFVSAIISRLLASGEEYSEELIIQTLKDLCPLVKVGDVTGRVPNVDKVRAFFGEKLHFPSLYHS